MPLLSTFGAASARGFGNLSGIILPVDDLFNSVAFLSHFDGSNSGVNNSFDDGSASNHTITAAGNVTQGSFSPFSRPDGAWSMVFDNSNNSIPYFALGANGEFDGNFTIEAFFNANSFTATNSRSPTIIAMGDPERLQVYIDSSSKFVALSQSSDQASQIVKSADNSISLNTWHHVAVVRSGSGSNNVSLYLDGARVAQATNTSTLGDAQGNSWIANSTSNAGQFGGNISNVRILKGTAQYSGSSITVPTSGLTNITNCVLLTAQSNRFVDNGANSLAILESGVRPSISAFGPFLTDAVYDPAVNGASAYFDGSDAFLTVSDSADLTPGNTFTFDAWIYPQVLNNYNTIMSQNGSTGYYWSILANGTLQFYTGGGGGGGGTHNSASGVVQKNQWNHVAYSVSGGTGYHFVNGVRSGSSHSNDIPNIAENLLVGVQKVSSFDLYGYGTDYRLVVGTALYTGSTYTVPTAPLTAITNTKLLLNMADGQAIDSAAQNNLTLYGNAKLSTTQAKFGDTSMVFDGTGDYVTLPSSSFKPFGTGDFTIECFARFDAINGKGLFQLGASYLPSAITGPAVFATTASPHPWRIYYGTSNVNASVSPSTDTWYHVAYVRSSGVTKLYVDGTSVISQNDTTNYTNTFFVIGGGYSSVYLMDGYIDDFRISHMARYTADFTAPTAPFADKGQ